MPVSESVFDRTVRQMIKALAPESVIDIGPGKGKYGKMIREIEAESRASIHKTCVEVDKEKIIDRFDLASIYDEIIHSDAALLPKKRPTLTGDLVIIADMIEHLTKSEGIDLLEFLQYRAKQIILVIPVDWISLEYQDYEHEAHISIWQKRDFARFYGASCVERLGAKGNRFLLAVLNHISTAPDQCFSVSELPDSSGAAKIGEDDIRFGVFTD